MADKHDPRSPGEVIGYPLQYSWNFPVAQMVKNPSAMQETWVQSLLGWEDPLGGGHDNPCLYSCLENPHGQKSLVSYSCKKLDTTKHSTACNIWDILILKNNLFIYTLLLLIDMFYLQILASLGGNK